MGRGEARLTSIDNRMAKRSGDKNENTGMTTQNNDKACGDSAEEVTREFSQIHQRAVVTMIQ